MVKELMHDPIFLAVKSEIATKKICLCYNKSNCEKFIGDKNI